MAGLGLRRGRLAPIALAPPLAIQIGSWAAAAGAVFAGIFSLAPEIDIDVARSLIDANGHFVGNGATVAAMPRAAFVALFVVACLVTAMGVVAAIWSGGNFLGVRGVSWVFVAACLGIGPGIVANVALKDQWQRARPVQVAELGGSRQFTPPLVAGSGQCQRNCSFVSGEASSIFMLFFAAAFVWPVQARRLLSAGVAAGLLAGFVRMCQGGHFLSDVLFAGVTMALVAAILDLLAAVPLGRDQAADR